MPCHAYKDCKGLVTLRKRTQLISTTNEINRAKKKVLLMLGWCEPMRQSIMFGIIVHGCLSLK